MAGGGVTAAAPSYAMCPWEGCSDLYREFTRHGGIYSTFGDLWFNRYILPVQHGRGEQGWRSNINGELVSGPHDLVGRRARIESDGWRTASRTQPVCRRRVLEAAATEFCQIETPLLSAANWGGHGLHLRGNIAGFERAGSSQRWLNFHSLEHWTEYYTREGSPCKSGSCRTF